MPSVQNFVDDVCACVGSDDTVNSSSSSRPSTASRVIGDGDAGKLFHMQTNIRFGCVILRHYLDRERGDTYMALGRYNGSRGRAEYPNAVYAAAKNWAHTDA